jgi:hypothetical protein
MVHRTVSMFELLPVLHLQSMGTAVSKANSFALAQEQLHDSWWPYDVLAQVREVWPRRRSRALELGCSVTRNPWVAVAAWTRIPSACPAAVRPLLTTRCLEALKDVAQQMTGTTR